MVSNSQTTPGNRAHAHSYFFLFVLACLSRLAAGGCDGGTGGCGGGSDLPCAAAAAAAAGSFSSIATTPTGTLHTYKDSVWIFTTIYYMPLICISIHNTTCTCGHTCIMHRIHRVLRSPDFFPPSLLSYKTCDTKSPDFHPFDGFVCGSLSTTTSFRLPAESFLAR